MIVEVLNSIVPQSDEDCSNLTEILNTTYLKKGENWIQEGKKNYNITFIEEGYLRKFYV